MKTQEQINIRNRTVNVCIPSEKADDWNTSLSMDRAVTTAPYDGVIDEFEVDIDANLTIHVKLVNTGHNSGCGPYIDCILWDYQRERGEIGSVEEVQALEPGQGPVEGEYHFADLHSNYQDETFSVTLIVDSA